MRHSLVLAWVVTALSWALAACNGDRDRSVGQTSFESAPPNGSRSGGRTGIAGTGSGGEDGAPTATGMPVGTRTVEETDLYRLDGNRLYYLNGYRGLMV